jgi:hypothetical protein
MTTDPATLVVLVADTYHINIEFQPHAKRHSQRRLHTHNWSQTPLLPSAGMPRAIAGRVLPGKRSTVHQAGAWPALLAMCSQLMVRQLTDVPSSCLAISHTQKYRTCLLHKTADSFQFEGQLCKFCQQVIGSMP